MNDVLLQRELAARAAGGFPNLREHLRLLDERGLLVTIREPVNKDTEMHPLVRW